MTIIKTFFIYNFINFNVSLVFTFDNFQKMNIYNYRLQV